MRQGLGWMLCLVLLLGRAGAAQDKPPIILGLHADMSSGSATAGEAIRRGALLAISEINAQGGLLGGRELQLMVRDHHGVPARSPEQLQEFAATPNLVAVLMGLHNLPLVQNLKLVQEHQLIFLSPWAAATDVVDNGMKPNYIFRVSIRDQDVGEFLVSKALEQGHARIGLLLEKTGWGRSSEKAMSEALARRKMAPVSVQWFNLADEDMHLQLEALHRAGAQAALLVTNAPEGAHVVKAMARRPPDKRFPLYSHWGITGGDFIRRVGPSLGQVDLRVVQTFFFVGARDARTQALIARYHELFKTKRVEDIIAPVGTAQAYDAVKLLALAIEKAGTASRPAVRDSLERLGPYRGLVRTYRPAFTPARHEALDLSDYKLAVFNSEGILVPWKP